MSQLPLLRAVDAVMVPVGETELVLSTNHPYAPSWLVSSVDEAVEAIVAAGGRPLTPVRATPVGRVTVVADPFGNQLVLLDLSTGRYVTDDHGAVVGVRSEPPQ